MIRSEKNKINHLSIVFSGMSSVSLGWGVRGMVKGEWGEAKPPPPLLDPLVSFSRKMAEGHGAVGEHGDGKPQMIKGPELVGPRGAAEPSTGQCWATGPTGPSCGLHSWLEGEQEAVGWGHGDQGCGLSAVGRATE